MFSGNDNTTMEYNDVRYRGCLLGTIETWPLGEVLVWLHETRRSAMLRIGGGINAGVIFFHEGDLYRCEWGHLQAEQALIALMGLEQGVFTLIQRDFPQPRANIIKPTAQVLLQCAVALDEQQRVLGVA